MEPVCCGFCAHCSQSCCSSSPHAAVMTRRPNTAGITRRFITHTSWASDQLIRPRLTEEYSLMCRGVYHRGCNTPRKDFVTIRIQFWTNSPAHTPAGRAILHHLSPRTPVTPSNARDPSSPLECVGLPPLLRSQPSGRLRSRLFRHPEQCRIPLCLCCGSPSASLPKAGLAPYASFVFGGPALLRRAALPLRGTPRRARDTQCCRHCRHTRRKPALLRRSATRLRAPCARCS